MHLKISFILLLFRLLLTALAAPGGTTERLEVRDLLDLDETGTLAPFGDGFEQLDVEADLDSPEFTIFKKKKNPCKRQCRSDSHCCHTDQCVIGVCLGPQKPPHFYAE